MTTAAEIELNDSRRKLESSLSEAQKSEYFPLLRQWFSIKSPLKKEEFDRKARQILSTEEQIVCHNHFLTAMLFKGKAYAKDKLNVHGENRGSFEVPDFSEYVQTMGPDTALPSNCQIRYASQELFMPDKGFMSCRVAVAAWENKMEGCDDEVTDLVVHACQVFVKNIITAMVSRLKGYKIRNGKFQYGFNSPIPDPFLRNYNNISDESQESKVVVEEDTLLPKIKPSLERAEHNVAYAHSCGRKRKINNSLSVQLLYDTLRGNPKLLGQYSMQSVSVLKLGIHLDEELAELETENSTSDVE